MKAIDLILKLQLIVAENGNDCPVFIADRSSYEGDVVVKTVKEWLPLEIPYGEPDATIDLPDTPQPMTAEENDAAHGAWVQAQKEGWG